MPFKSSVRSIYGPQSGKMGTAAGVPVNVTFTVPGGITYAGMPLSNGYLINGENFTVGTAAAISMTRSDGFRYFTLSAGTYSVTVAGAEGSSGNHGLGIIRTGTLTLAAPTAIHAVVGHNGTGSYSGGGMSGLAIGTSYTSSVPLFVAGGGGGGYSVANPQKNGREGTTGGTSGTPAYDAGAGWFANAVNSYSNSEPRAKAIRNGGRGGEQTACGAADIGSGGFGGGGGTCPAGGGGYDGGASGSNSPAGYGGGGGSSYHDSAYMTNVSTLGYRGTEGSTIFSATNTNASGYITIIKN